jgi:riboflavin synthase
MFTGLIHHIGSLASRRQSAGGGARVTIEAPSQLLERAEQGASIAVMGVCLTLAAKGPGTFEADITQETLSRTTLGSLPIGAPLNLEPSLLLGGPMDGHIVTGHVDAVGQLQTGPDAQGCWHFAFPPHMSPLLAPKGSIAIDGVSLTIAGIAGGTFSVALIPETMAATTLKNLAPGDRVNLEADPIARYVARIMSLQGTDKKLREFVQKGWNKFS